MNPQVGQYAKIYFRNGMQTEGRITSWSEGQSVVLLPDEKSSCLIMKTAEDIISVQIFYDLGETTVGLREHMSNLEEQFQDTYATPSNDDLRLKKLADLKTLMVEQEKKIIQNKLVDHNISEAVRPQYGNPFLKK